MAIEQDIQQIRTAVYGRDVREALADGLEQCYSDVTTAKTIADDSIDIAAGHAQAAANSATLAGQHADTASGYKDNAAASATAAASSATAAAGSATEAAQSASSVSGMVSDINAAGATQIAAIEAKRTEVIDAVEAKRLATLADIPDGYEELGASVSEVKNTVNDINGVIRVTGAPTVTWTLGNIGSTGSNTSYKNTIRCTYFMARKGSVISADSGYVIRVFLYATTDDSTFISRSDFVTSYQFSDNYKVRLLVTDTAHTSQSSGDLTDTSYSEKVDWSEFVLGTIDEQIAPVLASDVPGMAVKLDRLYPYNLWNYGTYSDNTALHANTGAPSNNDQYDTTDFIPVTPGEIVYGKGARFWCYDSEKTIVSGATGILTNLDTEIGYSNHYYIIPENAAYFRISRNKSTMEQFLAKVNALEYLLMTKTDGLPGENERKKLYAIGDSITRGMYTSIGDTSSRGPTQYGYPYWIGKINSFDVVNLGESGGGYAFKGTQTNSNGKDIVDNNAFDDADIITIALGVNDYKGSGVTLGSMESTAGDGSTIGNMKYMIETLADPVNGKAKQAQIIVLLPMNEKRVSEGTLATNWAFGYAFREDKTLADYRDAIRECAEYYNVRVIDLEEVCPINRLNIGNVLGDGLHPTIAFYEQMGRALAPLIH